MKIAITGTGFFLIFILTVAIVMSLGKDNTEYEKLTDAVELAAYQSLKEGVEWKTDPGDLFVENIEVLLDEDCYVVTIIASDYEKGILSVEVEITYENMGKSREVKVERTVIFECEV